jgi:hypothetical protein
MVLTSSSCACWILRGPSAAAEGFALLFSHLRRRDTCVFEAQSRALEE